MPGRPLKVPARMILRKVGALAFVGLVMVSFPLRAFGKDAFQYDPSTCKIDAKGHLYIALGPNVLSVPYSKSGVYLLDPVLPKAKRPAPDPSEQEGCLGNPTQQRSVAFLAGAPFTDIEQSHSKLEHRERPTKLTLYDTSEPRTGADSNPPRWFGEHSPNFLELMCSPPASRETLPNGLNACRTPLRGKPDARTEDLGGTYFSDASVYATPLGRRFVVNCTPYLYSGPLFGNCDVAYSIASDLAVSYEFQPYRGRSPIPIDHIIEFDRKLRTQIAGAIMTNFIWPSETGGK